MNIRKAALITTTLLFMLTGVMAQTGSISGSVIDGSGAALAGANVMVEGTDLGAATDVGGNYSISGVSTGTHTVTASFVGYQSSSQSVVVGVGNNTVNFSLAISAIAGREVAVIGSRFSHTAEDLAVPVDVFTAAEIRATGFAETAQILQALAPSFNMPRTSISDGSDTVRPMTLRGLGSGQVLVLVNGKRRHTTALVHVNNSPSRGDTGVDLNAIPAAAIERIEVLRDGAAAQYGSDAIAGVINIVLKSGNSGGAFNVYTGQNEHVIEAIPVGYDMYGIKYGDETIPYTWNPTTEVTYERTDGDPMALVTSSEDYTINDGAVTQYQLSRGFSIGNGGSLFIAAEIRDRARSNRVGFEGEQYYEPNSDYWSDDEAESQRLQSGSNWFIDPFRMIWGDQAQSNKGFMFNADLPAGDKRYYAFGGATSRAGDTGCFTRQPDQGNKVWLSSNPTGFVPHIQPTVSDYSTSMGVEGVFGSWSYDLSNTYGTNDYHFYMMSTNTSYGPEQLRSYDIGGFKFNQNSTNLDATTRMGNIDLAVGLESRAESFRIYAGETASFASGQAGTNIVGWDSSEEDSLGNVTYTGLNSSTAGSGCQCFSGFKPSNELATNNADRSVLAFYGDAEMDLGFARFGGAVRMENYADKQIDGSDNTYSNLGIKATVRSEPMSGVVVRGAFSTGFRAPALAQAYQAKIATNFLPDPVTGETVAFEVGTFPVSHGFPQALGAEALTPETSTNISAGTSLNISGIRVSVDYYSIDIKDRIVLTGNFTGDDDPDANPFGYAVQSLLDAANENASGGRFFMNGVDTKTSGIDITAAYGLDIGGLGAFDISLGYNSTSTEIDAINLPTGLSSSPEPTVISDEDFVAAAKNTMFDSREQRTMTSSQPASNMVLGVNWSGYSLPVLGVPIGVNFKMHQFGEYHSRYAVSTDPGYFTTATYDDGFAQVYSAVTTMDLEVTADLGAMSIAFGAKNLTDEMPEKNLLTSRNNDGAFVYPSTSPNGMNGKFVYTRLSFNF
jgi:iron complex outermembrane receptor protein